MRTWIGSIRIEVRDFGGLASMHVFLPGCLLIGWVVSESPRAPIFLRACALDQAVILPVSNPG